ncbi:MAG: TetR/AcrR family transcriptional regulator [Rhodanobacteraceae bacterium]
MHEDIDTARGRLSADDWVSAALERIAEDGLGKLAIEPLAKDLGVTKGSFYWHFRSRNALVDAVLERWRQLGERDLLADLGAIADPRQRLRQVFQRVAAEVQSHRVHAALLKALEIPRVRDAVENAAQQHLALLAEAYRQIGQSPGMAMNSARLAYAAYLGFMQMNLVFGRERISQEQYNDYVEHLIATLVP